MSDNDLTQAELRELLEYDPVTDARYSGRPAGSLDRKNGYMKLLNRPAHRLAWIYEHGPIPDGLIVGHREHGFEHRRDTRIGSLRLITATESQHDHAPALSASDLVGASFHKGIGRWRATCCEGGRTRHLGSFGSQLEAAFCYDAHVTANRGEFGRPNFPAVFSDRAAKVAASQLAGS